MASSKSQQKREARLKEKTNELGKEIRLLEYQVRTLNDLLKIAHARESQLIEVIQDLTNELRRTRPLQVPYPVYTPPNTNPPSYPQPYKVGDDTDPPYKVTMDNSAKKLTDKYLQQ